ncbi:MAG: signal peptidase II [bacterium]|nr:signal peptidase II [bacterium]
MLNFISIKKIVAIYTAIIFFIAADRWFKVLAIANQGRQIDLIGDILKFNYQANYYIAFSLPLAGQVLEILLVLIISALIFSGLDYWFRHKYSEAILLSLIVLGAISNLFDRLKYGYVIDYLNLKYFTVFNLADALIVFGVIFLIIILNKKNA